jgi:cytochrome c553
LAVNCSHCHSPDGVLQEFLRNKGEGHVVPPPLAGMPTDQIIARVNAFRDDESQAATMHRVAKQYNEQQIREVAAYLARQPAIR